MSDSGEPSNIGGSLSPKSLRRVITWAGQKNKAEQLCEKLDTWGGHMTDEELEQVANVVLGAKRRFHEIQYRETIEQEAKRLCTEDVHPFDALPAENVLMIMHRMSNKDAANLSQTSHRMWEIYNTFAPKIGCMVVGSLKKLRALAKRPQVLQTSRIHDPVLAIRQLTPSMLAIRGLVNLLQQCNTIVIGQSALDPLNSLAILCKNTETSVLFTVQAGQYYPPELAERPHVHSLGGEVYLSDDAYSNPPHQYRFSDFQQTPSSVIYKLVVDIHVRGPYLATEGVSLSTNEKELIRRMGVLKACGVKYIHKVYLSLTIHRTPPHRDNRGLVIHGVCSAFRALCDTGMFKTNRDIERAIATCNNSYNPDNRHLSVCTSSSRQARDILNSALAQKCWRLTDDLYDCDSL